MIVTETSLRGVLLIQPPTTSEDYRGSYVEVYNRKVYHEAGITVDFVQDDISVSYRHVLRGIHGDDRTWKLVSCAAGRLYHVVVDCRQESSTYLMWESFLLSDENHNQVLIPPQFGNAFLVLSEVATFAYKQSTYYEGARQQFTLRWDDPKINITWPIHFPILSHRDMTARLL
jgi:dTDP-4-dehydrorhamnose 3,5-epimerase